MRNVGIAQSGSKLLMLISPLFTPRKNNLPSYAEMKGTVRAVPKTSHELTHRVKDLEKEVKQKEKELLDEKEKVEILKKSLHIFMRQGE